ncbi:MAG: aspartate kinase [Candidatus Hydrogenedentota bacterium]
MGSITCKFGGSSLASTENIEKAIAIIQSNDDRKYIVPSAPGKRSDDDKKITDLLLGWFHILQDDLDPAQPITIIRDRFNALREGLACTVDIDAEIDAIIKEAPSYSSPDFLASRGEYLNGKLIADKLGATFVDPVSVIHFDTRGNLDPATYESLGQALEGDGRFVIPGYYGSGPDGHVKTFGRGGSDVTGSVVARATGSTLYENWTDVSGFRMTDPRIVPHAHRIEEITYGELRELAYMGASVLHDEAIFPLLEPGIPINIRNTNDPENSGTMILRDRVAQRPVCGIAARGGFSMINIEKTLMNRELGFALKVLTVLRDLGINFEHMPTGIDTMSVIVKDEELGDKGQAVVDTIREDCHTDSVTLTNGLALIATVGKGMNHHVGVAKTLCAALSDDAKVNIRVLDQGSSETNIIVGVDEPDMHSAVNAIYNAFERRD